MKYPGSGTMGVDAEEYPSDAVIEESRVHRRLFDGTEIEGPSRPAGLDQRSALLSREGLGAADFNAVVGSGAAPARRGTNVGSWRSG